MTTADGIPAVDVLGVRVGVLRESTLIDLIQQWIETGVHEFVTFTGVHGVMECQRDPDLTDVHNRAGVVAPDGMPMVWAGRWVGFRDGGRCYGPDCMLATCQRAAAEGWPIFLYGGAPGVAERLAERLRARFPGLDIVGWHSPPFRELTDSEVDEEIELINRLGAKLVFVGLSTPKQERWMAARQARLDPNVLLGVGAAFDFHAGLVRQAPRWMQRSGLEWAFRLATEPRRLAKRYVRNNPEFVWRVARRPPRTVAGR